MEDYGKSLYAFLYDRQKDNKGNALFFAGRYIAYPKLFREINRAASALKRFGMKKGEVITVALPNVPDAVYLLYGAAKLGVTVNLVHPLLPFSQLKHYAEKFKSSLLFLFDSIADGYADRLADVDAQVVLCSAADSITPFERIFYNAATAHRRSNLKDGFIRYADFVSNKTVNGAENSDGQEPAVNSDGTEIAVIMHSSGTTDKPKSAALSHKAFNVESDAIIQGISNDGERTKNAGMLAALPMFHAFGLGCGIHCALTQGVVSVLVPKFSAKLIVKYINTGKVTYLSGVPTMYKGIAACRRFDSGKVRKLVTAFCGGDVLDPKLKRRFDDVMIKHGSRCRLHEGYGMTEVAGVFSANKNGQCREGSVGKPLIDCFFIEAFDGEKILPRRSQGELCISSDAVMLGYAGDGGITAGEEFFSGGGRRWVRTGDYGYVDDDGFIYFTNRLKRVVKVSGVNVFPAQVEKTLAELDCVKSVAVKPTVHAKKGHVLCAYVVAEGDRQAAEKEIVNYAVSKLDKWSRPHKVVFIDAMPLTPLGKTDYEKLEE